MTRARIRKLVTIVEEVRSEMGRKESPPTRRAAANALIGNPCAGCVEDLEELMAIGEELGDILGDACVKALGIPPGDAQSDGKAALVGLDGELEHAAAILHPRLGKPLARRWKRVRPWCRRTRSAAQRAIRSTFPSATRSRPMSGRISTAWRSA